MIEEKFTEKTLTGAIPCLNGRQRMIFCIVSLVVTNFICLGFVGLLLRSSDTIINPRPPGLIPATAAIVANGAPCARIGRDILETRNGSVADAAIATILCDSIVCPTSLGLGGGLMATIYIRSTGESLTLNAREVAPLAATADMFVNRKAVLGAEAIAMPGALAGYWALHQRFGRLPWASLFDEAIAMCERGVPVTKKLSMLMQHFEPEILRSPSLSTIYRDPATGRVWSVGQLVRLPRLAETLRVLARDGVASFYQTNGTINRRMRADLDAMNNGSVVLSERDFSEYKVRWGAPAKATLMRGERTVLSTGLPSTGFLASFVVRVLDGMEGLDRDAVQTYHWLVEAFKWAFAKRTELADPVFVPEVQKIADHFTSDEHVADVRNRIRNTKRTSQKFSDYGAKYAMVEDKGTSHINILAANGDAIAVTSTLNDFFGCRIASSSTGIIFNSQMDDFSNPGIENTYHLTAAPANNIAPGKQPLSSLSPTIVLDAAGNVRMMVGGAGGTKITTGVAYALVRHLYFNETIEQVVRAPRLHHQLRPNEIEHEFAFNQTILTGLRNDYGHELVPIVSIESMSDVLAIGRDEHGKVTAGYSGSVEVF